MAKFRDFGISRPKQLPAQEARRPTTDRETQRPTERKPEEPKRQRRVNHGRVSVGVQMTVTARDQMKKLAVERGVPMHSLYAEALNAYFRNNNLPEVA